MPIKMRVNIARTAISVTREKAENGRDRLYQDQLVKPCKELAGSRRKKPGRKRKRVKNGIMKRRL